MKFLKKIYSSKLFWPLVIVLFFAVLAGRSLIFEKGYFNMHDDLQMMRQLEMEKCFLDGQIPCRWVPDMGYGFGFPLFNFYPPLPYLIGEAFRVMGGLFTTSAKLTFALSFIVSGIGMFLLTKEFFSKSGKGGKANYLGPILASVFYVWAPYRSVDVYVRGAMNEAWALAWFPFIFWCAYRLIKDSKNQNKWIIGLALSWFALLTSHNLMVIAFGPLFGGWVLLHLWLNKKWSRIPQFIYSGLLSFGLAAFFTIPALLENKFTHIESVLVGYYDYSAHFVNLKQLLISRFWGYGPSVWNMVDDGMPFQIGHIHWVLSLVVGGWIYLQLRKISKTKTTLRSTYYVILFMIASGWIAAFLTHTRSTFIWQILSFMRYLQFPWRLLVIPTFTFSFAIGFIPELLAQSKIALFIKRRSLIVVLLAIGLVAFNWNYFRPELGHMGPLTDEEKLSGVAWDLQQTAGIYDYLPKWAETAPKEPMKKLVEVMKGQAEASDTEQGTNWASFKINVTDEKAVIRLGIFYFPGWRVFVDDQEIGTYIHEEEKWGRMYIDIVEGEHRVEAKFYNTPVRKVGNILSLVTWLGLFSFPFLRRKTS